MIALVEYPCSTGSRMTAPPRASTVSRPTISIRGPVGALDENVRLHAPDDVGRCVFGEDRDRVDAGQRFEHLGALRFRIDRARRTLVAAHRRVGIEANDQHVAVAPGGLQVTDVARMQDVKDAVSEDDAPAGGAGIGDEPDERFRIQHSS